MAVLHEDEFTYFNAKIVALIRAMVETLVSEKIAESLVETGADYDYEG